MEIINYPNYLIYDDGRVYSKKRNIFLKQILKTNGYYCVNLYLNSKRYQKYIHRLLAEHYLPLVEGKELVDHIDRDKTNNHISNLRWCNISENNTNIDIQKNNITGYKNILITKYNTYQFRLNRQNTKICKHFKTLEECIEYRDRYLENH